MTGAIRTAPTAALEVCLPFIEAEAHQYVYKKVVCGWTAVHSNLLVKSQFSDPKDLMPSDRIAATYFFGMRYQTMFPERDERVDRHPLKLNSPDLVTYMDSSKLNLGSGV